MKWKQYSVPIYLQNEEQIKLLEKMMEMREKLVKGLADLVFKDEPRNIRD